MSGIELTQDQLIRKGKYPAPNIPGYDSLFFNELTRGHSTQTYLTWGAHLTAMCQQRGIDYYYFYNDHGTKINVYPVELIEEWWNNSR